MIGLEPEEEAGGQAEIAGQAQVGVGGDRPFAEDDLVDAARRNVKFSRERGLAERQRREELLEKISPGSGSAEVRRQ